MGILPLPVMMGMNTSLIAAAKSMGVRKSTALLAVAHLLEHARPKMLDFLAVGLHKLPHGECGRSRSTPTRIHGSPGGG